MSTKKLIPTNGKAHRRIHTNSTNDVQHTLNFTNRNELCSNHIRKFSSEGFRLCVRRPLPSTCVFNSWNNRKDPGNSKSFLEYLESPVLYTEVNLPLPIVILRQNKLCILYRTCDIRKAFPLWWKAFKGMCKFNSILRTRHVV